MRSKIASGTQDNEDQQNVQPATMHGDAPPPTPLVGKRRKTQGKGPKKSKRPRVLDEDHNDSEDVPIAEMLLKIERKAAEERKFAAKKADVDIKGKARMEVDEEKKKKKTKTQVREDKEKVENVFVLESKIPKLWNKRGILELRKDYTMLVCRTSSSVISTYVLSQSDFTPNQRNACNTPDLHQ